MPDWLLQVIIMPDGLWLTEKLFDCDLVTITKDSFNRAK